MDICRKFMICIVCAVLVGSQRCALHIKVNMTGNIRYKTKKIRRPNAVEHFVETPHDQMHVHRSSFRSLSHKPSEKNNLWMVTEKKFNLKRPLSLIII